MRELRARLWHWQAPHPDWTPRQRWAREVSSYAIDDGERLLLRPARRARSTPRARADLEWLRSGGASINRLRPLLELPVEFVLPAHGAPADRAALERALS